MGTYATRRIIELEERLRDEQAKSAAMRVVVERVAVLNRDASEIGAGMLASLVDAARDALAVADAK